MTTTKVHTNLTWYWQQSILRLHINTYKELNIVNFQIRTKKKLIIGRVKGFFYLLKSLKRNIKVDKSNKQMRSICCKEGHATSL